PAKTDAPLIVDAYRMLASAIARKRLQPIAGWNPQVIKGHGRHQCGQFALRRSQQIGCKALGDFTRSHLLGELPLERPDHRALGMYQYMILCQSQEFVSLNDTMPVPDYGCIIQAEFMPARCNLQCHLGASRLEQLP